jgi:prophage regulatory protein
MRQEMDRLMRKKEVVNLTGMSSTTIWRLMKKNQFPQSRQLSSRVVVWLESEILEWLEGIRKAA